MSRSRAARWLIIMGAIFYSSFLIELAAGYPLLPTRSFLSELAALDQPTSVLVRTTDAVAGICFFIGGLLCWRRLNSQVTGEPESGAGGNASTEPDKRFSAPTEGIDVHTRDAARVAGGRRITGLHIPDFLKRFFARWRFTVCLGIVLTGAFTVLDSFFPMDCAEVDPACVARVAAGTVSLSHHVHAVTSSLAGTGIVVVAVGCVAAWLHHRSNALDTVLGLLACGVIVSMSAELLALAVGWPIGIAQRIQVVLSVVMFIVVAVPLTSSTAGRVRSRG